jgi:hypothetical protein
MGLLPFADENSSDKTQICIFKELQIHLSKNMLSFTENILAPEALVVGAF